MEAAEARRLTAGYEASMARIADQAPPLPADAVALLRATGFPVGSTVRGHTACGMSQGGRMVQPGDETVRRVR
jgi:hypothetical protein